MFCKWLIKFCLLIKNKFIFIKKATTDTGLVLRGCSNSCEPKYENGVIIACCDNNYCNLSQKQAKIMKTTVMITLIITQILWMQ